MKPTLNLKSKSAKPLDAKMALLTADAFFAIAGRFFAQVPDDLNASADFAGQRPGELAAAVTNLALAIELYIKALTIRAGFKPQEIHNLLALFEALPDPLRDSIEARYNLADPNLLTAFEMVKTSTPEALNEEAVRRELSQLLPSGEDIRSVLEAERNAFENWRYIHELGKAGEPCKVAVIRVNFRRLGLIANTLREHSRSYT